MGGEGGCSNVMRFIQSEQASKQRQPTVGRSRGLQGQGPSGKKNTKQRGRGTAGRRNRMNYNSNSMRFMQSERANSSCHPAAGTDQGLSARAKGHLKGNKAGGIGRTEGGRGCDTLYLREGSWGMREGWKLQTAGGTEQVNGLWTLKDKQDP